MATQPSTATGTTRTTRKRALNQAAAVTNAPKKAKTIKWEWLGDGGNWNRYTDQNNEDLITAFASGKDECVVGVAQGVKMKARFNVMSQTNQSTGWQRDIRCISNDPQYVPPIWEWTADENKEEESWNKFPESASRLLEAAHLCGIDKVETTVASNAYNVDLDGKEMTDKNTGTSNTIRRRSIQKSKAIWEWMDEQGQWNAYNNDHATLLEDAHTSQQSKKRGGASVTFTVNGQNYRVDLKKMLQVNVSTNCSRQVRRKGEDTTSDNEGAEPMEEEAESVTVKEESSTVKPKKRPRGTNGTDPSSSGNDTSKVVKRTNSKSVRNAEESTSQSKSTPGSSASVEDASVKSQIFTGKCPVDTECKAKLGKANVFCEGSTVWNCTLNQTNIRNNNNKFYIIQLLEDSGARKNYSVWFRWGRVGKTGQNNLQSFGSDLDSAKKIFTRKFSDKTNNAWESRNSFVKVAGKYDLVEVDYEAKEETDAVDEELSEPEEVAKPKSKLDARLQSLIELICNVQAMEDAVKEMKYDTKKAPLGKLTSSQIKQGYVALKKIDTILSESKTITSDQSAKLVKASDEFYTRVPHDFGMRTPPVIKTKEQVKQKLALLETLGDIQIALKVIQGGDKTIKEHPVDRHYKELHCELEPLDFEDDTFKLIEKYIRQTHGKTHTDYTLTVTDVFEMDKQGEKEKFSDLGNRQLLWHGSRLTNWVGIISQGMRIAPPEAPVTGYMFGKGVYFADVASKSANYCFATPSKNEGICILCDVSLGSSNELLAADYNANKLPAGKHSVKGMGRMGPDPAHNHTLDDGCIVPLGPTHDTGVRNSKGYTLNYNEYIVYDTTQIKMKYLVRLKFNFK